MMEVRRLRMRLRSGRKPASIDPPSFFLQLMGNVPPGNEGAKMIKKHAASPTANNDTPGRTILCRIAHIAQRISGTGREFANLLRRQDGSEQFRPFKIPVLSDHGTGDELFFSLYSGPLN
jgi:hypothetical protein